MPGLWSCRVVIMADTSRATRYVIGRGRSVWFAGEAVMPSLWAGRWVRAGVYRSSAAVAAVVVGVVAGSSVVVLPAVAAPPAWPVPAAPVPGRSTPVTAVAAKTPTGSFDSDTAAGSVSSS